LWENLIWPVLSKNKITSALEKKFAEKNQFTKVFGNHDLFWSNDPFTSLYLKNMYGQTVKIYEGVVLETKYKDQTSHLFLTHGHQGDGQSDSNVFSAWFVSRIWAPLQSFLQLNPNTPSSSKELKTAHNLFMYEWSKLEKNPVLITGHTHQPVFASLTHLERLYKQFISAKEKEDEDVLSKINSEIQFRQQEYDFVTSNYTTMKPFYFNTGCCCFSDGDITGIELADGMIRLIKWRQKDRISERIILEEMVLSALFSQ
jgi:predicted phosphodiesterase